MRRQLIPAMGLLILVPALAAAQGLAGTWQGTQRFGRGGRGGRGFTVQSTYVFQTVGEHFTGTAATPRLRSDIVDGAITGSRIAFRIRNPFRPQAPGVAYTGTLAGGALTVERADGGGGMGRRGFTPPPLVLHKVSDDTVYHLPPGLAHAPLPPVRPLPPNGLALTPPMGWNSWNKFKGAVNDQDIRRTADLMVSSGMRNAGYIYVNIDDTWEGGRDAQGNIESNAKFPDMKALAAYVHAKGLKLGIYSSPGPTTCAGYTGSYNHEAQDARTYAAWGVDYLKYDWCSAASVYTAAEMPAVYEKMALALRATGRPIVFSLCQYGELNVEDWGAEVGGNLWRISGDIQDNYASMIRNGFGDNRLRPYAGPGHWNDPDMLEIGNGGMTDTEYRTHFSLWAMLAAPLLAGNDLSTMTPAIRSILTNREVIAIDQDRLGEQGYRVSEQGPMQVWKRQLADGATAVALFNTGTVAAPVTVRWAALGLRANPRIRDLWAQRNFRSPASYTATVPGHGVVLLRVR